MQAAVTCFQQADQYKAIAKLFTENRIRYLPLKGIVLREYYEVPALRFSCDLDILIHNRDFARTKQLLTQDDWTTDGRLSYDQAVLDQLLRRAGITKFYEGLLSLIAY